jgi:hypothetical protein
MHGLRKKNRPTAVSTHGLEEELDKNFSSLQAQMDLLEKLQRIFGESPEDPLIRFQIRKIK